MTTSSELARLEDRARGAGRRLTRSPTSRAWKSAESDHAALTQLAMRAPGFDELQRAAVAANELRRAMLATWSYVVSAERTKAGAKRPNSCASARPVSRQRTRRRRAVRRAAATGGSSDDSPPDPPPPLARGRALLHDDDANPLEELVRESLLSLRTVAARLDVDRSLAWRWIASGRLTAIDLNAGLPGARPCWRVPEGALRAFLRRCAAGEGDA